MICGTGHRILARVRSHKKLRIAAPEEDENPLQARQHSDSMSSSVSRSSSTKSVPYSRSHYPPIEWDPLKLNPPVPEVPRPPKRTDSLQERTLRPKRSFAGHELRTRPRMHQSDSGFSLEIHEGFDFGFERQKAIERMLEQNRARDEAVHGTKGWPSPATSTISEGSWFDDDDDDDDDGDGAVRRRAELLADTPPTPRRRPLVGSPDDPTYFLKRGGWKRRGIVFGSQSDEVYATEEDAFDLP